MNGFSPAPKEQRLCALKSLIPEAFCEGKIDWEKLKAALGEDINFSNERYVLNWAGKSDILKIGLDSSAVVLDFFSGSGTTADAAVENIVYELLLKSGKDLNSKIVRGNGFYNVNDGELVLLLESASQEIVDSVIALAPAKVIALDRLFHGNDQLKTNTSLQFRDSAIEFLTI